MDSVLLCWLLVALAGLTNGVVVARGDFTVATHTIPTPAQAAPFKRFAAVESIPTPPPSANVRGQKFADAWQQLKQQMASEETVTSLSIPPITADPAASAVASAAAASMSLHGGANVPFIVSDPSHTDIIAFAGTAEAPDGAAAATTCCVFDTKSYEAPSAQITQNDAVVPEDDSNSGAAVSSAAPSSSEATTTQADTATAAAISSSIPSSRSRVVTSAPNKKPDSAVRTKDSAASSSSSTLSRSILFTISACWILSLLI